MSKAPPPKSAADLKPGATAAERSADPARAKNIEMAVSAITKEFGEGSIMRLGSATRMVVDTISTGSLAIPVYPELTTSQQEYLVDRIRQFYRN